MRDRLESWSDWLDYNHHGFNFDKNIISGGSRDICRDAFVLPLRRKLFSPVSNVTKASQLISDGCVVRAWRLFDLVATVEA